MAIIWGVLNVVFGVKKILPLRGFPEGKKRIVLRQNDFARIYVKTSSGIMCYHIKEENAAWEPYILIEENYRTN